MKKIYIAPMAGVTDYAFRQILKQYKPDLMYAEMVNSNLFIKEHKKTLNTIMKMSTDEKTGIQLFGSDMDELIQNFSKLHELGYTNLLLNMGCPQHKITKRGCGATLLDKIDEIEYLLASLKKKDIRISLKLRNCKNILNFFELANKYEIPYLCLHSRTKEEKFENEADFTLIHKLAKLDRNFDFIANGGIYSLEDYKKLQNENIDGIMLARGVIGRPWLIKEIKEGKKYSPSLQEVKEIVISHMNYILEDKGIKKASIEINKFLEAYFKDFNVDVNKIILEQDFEKKIELVQSASL